VPFNPFKAPPREHPPSPETMASLREKWLDGTMASQAPSALGPNDLIAVVMEVSVGKGFATFVSGHDGHTGMYLDSGGGIIGAGFHVATAASSLALIGCAKSYATQIPVATEFPSPKSGFRTFWLVFRDSVRGVSLPQVEVKMNSPIQPLFAAGENVITNLRLVDTRIKKGEQGKPSDYVHIFPDGGTAFLTFGNGTPTLLTLRQLSALLAIARQREEHLNISTLEGNAKMQEQVTHAIKESGVECNNIPPLAGLVHPRGETTLHNAVKASRIDVIEDLVGRGADINSKDDDGYTPLAMAANFGRESVLAALVRMGADVLAQDNVRNSVLMFAAQYGDPKPFKLLLDSGADLNIQAKNGYTALTVARLCGLQSTRIVRLLEDLKAPE
jgi:Ankyrin repeats (3 copies)/Ankyrin repeat